MAMLRQLRPFRTRDGSATARRVLLNERRGGLMEDSMFDEQFVTTAEEIKEARAALADMQFHLVRTVPRNSC